MRAGRPSALHEQRPDPLAAAAAGRGHQGLGADPELAGGQARLHQLQRPPVVGPVAHQQGPPRPGTEAAQVAAARQGLASGGCAAADPTGSARRSPAPPPRRRRAAAAPRPLASSGSWRGPPPAGQRLEAGLVGLIPAGLHQQIAAAVAADVGEEQLVRAEGLGSAGAEAGPAPPGPGGPGGAGAAGAGAPARPGSARCGAGHHRHGAAGRRGAPAW